MTERECRLTLATRQGRAMGRRSSFAYVGEPFETAECPSPEDLLGYVDGQSLDRASEELLRHLDQCATCRLVIAEAARAIASSVPGPDARSLRTLADGERVADRYEIRGFVAQGGMGEVYEAFDSALSETVALKTLILTSVDQADAAER